MNNNTLELSAQSNHNLPAHTTGFVGRKQELEDLAFLLTDLNVRMITLLSPGGMGKTRLALAVAEQQLSNYVDGVYFVRLASLDSVDSIVPAITSTINLSFRPGIDPLTQLLDYVKTCEILFVLDNYEHLLDGANVVTAILHAAPLVQIIVTSRERLYLSGETIYLVGAMDLPHDDINTDVLEYSAVELFLQSAKQLRPTWIVDTKDLHYIVRISHLTYGMPLAIILAATWVNILSLAEIADEIEHNLDFLQAKRRDLPNRFQSIRAVFVGTWNRLSEEERQTFQRLSIFRGGCLYEAVTQITETNLTILKGLIDKALVVRNDDGRFEIHEVLRQYGEECLAEAPHEYVYMRDRHCEYYANFTLQMYEGHHTSETRMWLALMDAELENLLCGWDWAIQHVKRDALWQFSKLYLFYSLRCRYQEGEVILARSVTALEGCNSENQPDILLGRLLAFHVYLCHYIIQIEKMETSYRKSLEIILQADNLGKDRETVAILYFLGSSVHFIRPQEAQELLEKCVEYCRLYNHRDALMVAALMNRFSFVPWLGQDSTGIKQGLHLAQQLGYLRGIAMFSQYQGMISYWEGRDAIAAKNWLNKSIDLHRNTDDPLNLAGALVTLADIVMDGGNYQTAKENLLEALNIYNANGCLPWILSPALVCIARLLFAGANKQGSAQLCACVQQAPFLNRPRFHPTNIIKNPDPTGLWVELKNALPTPTLTLATETGRRLNKVSVIKTALILLEQTDFLSPAPSVMSNLDTLNQKLSNNLTPREYEVFQFILAGYSNHAIATELVISKNTLKTHISRLYHKLAVKNRAQAILCGRDLELLI